MIRVLLVEDSVTQREILRRLLNGDGAFSVIAEARNGREAVELVEQCRPDVVLMDIHMPDMNGVEATREIMRRFPVPIVIASATLKKREMDLGLEALKAGAVSVIAKPEGAVLLHLEKIAPQLREELLSASKAKVRRFAAPQLSPSPPARPPVDLSSRLRDIQVIGICVSTGGPPLLLEMFSAVPKPYPLPVLLVQHISFGFEEGFARWLSDSTGQSVSLAANGQRLEPGIWIAPGGWHLTFASRTRLDLRERQPADIHCPSGDPLFESLGKHFGANAVGVVLTGMGDDGARGLLALNQAGGVTLIQDESSSLIWGMPKAAKQLNAAALELSPEQIVRVMTEVAESKFANHCPTIP
jgi:two-component system, chemotaxis family, protein-glutamate methylesterase/glutaminase